MSDAESERWTFEVPRDVPGMYAAYLQLAIHGQENKTLTLYNFLVANSVLMLAWATIFSASATLPHALAATLLCMLGFMAAAVWQPIGPDYSDASDLYGRCVRQMEAHFPEVFPTPLTEREKQREKKKQPTSDQPPEAFPGTRSRDLMTWTPRALIVAYGILAMLTWASYLCAPTS